MCFCCQIIITFTTKARSRCKTKRTFTSKRKMPSHKTPTARWETWCSVTLAIWPRTKISLLCAGTVDFFYTSGELLDAPTNYVVSSYPTFNQTFYFGASPVFLKRANQFVVWDTNRLFVSVMLSPYRFLNRQDILFYFTAVFGCTNNRGRLKRFNFSRLKWFFSIFRAAKRNRKSTSAVFIQHRQQKYHKFSDLCCFW